MTRTIYAGGVPIGGDNPIVVQSMTNTDTRDVTATVTQIQEMQAAGCELVRVAVPDMEAARALADIRQHIHIPLVADIHFDHRLALEACRHVDKLRINPGNIGSRDRVAAVVKECHKRGIPIRIGVNLGSIDKRIEREFGRGARALVESAQKHVRILEALGFYDIAVSLKASEVNTMVEAYRIFARESQYPLHLGVTEAGTRFSGTVKSSVGIGSLLLDGIGDTIRVSLSDDRSEEIAVAYETLKATGARECGREMICCPGCGRTHGNMIHVATEIEKRTAWLSSPVRIAVMGCEVNGPGEARDADIGLAMEKRGARVFSKGEVLDRIVGDEHKIIEQFITMIDERFGS